MSRSATAPHTSNSRSARVDLPWSMWAMMLKFLMFSCFIATSFINCQLRRLRRRGGK